ncbi:ferredoxin [Pedobacter sp. B4-66]|uniref:ferredoxin n=1 Tax=Pedobacter sp. B4-66 TaxID=2817280 RepID=UPI001BD9F1B0|nr:ferredoxin [Pedobacter sp. B4-66]
MKTSVTNNCSLGQLNRYPENSYGDFYVENQVCTACGAPEAEAPDLIEHSKLEYGHCYFKKQPQTPEELDRAINALSVSCISGIRYGGKDEVILKRLYEMGLEDECDHKPIGKYKMVVRNKVVFQYQETMEKPFKRLASWLYKRVKGIK